MSAPQAEAPSFRTLVQVFARIGVLSFGGPAGQIALMHRELVDERKWVSDARFLHALQYCTLIPGPEAQQLATYIGFLLHGTRGGLAAGLLFVIPGAIVLALLSSLYVASRSVPVVAAVLFGVKCAVLGIVLEALARIAKRGLVSRVSRPLAFAAFAALFFFRVPFPLVVLSAGLFGVAGNALAPSLFPRAASKDTTAKDADTYVVDRLFAQNALLHTRPSRGRALTVTLVTALLLAAPFAMTYAAFGPRSIFFEQATLFGKAAFVTFGGAYAVLAYVAQDAVERRGWLATPEMMDGLGLAETTPGPLILVLEFVAFVAAFRAPTGLPPYLAGALASCVMLWMTFVPCFFFIFLGAPYVESLRENERLHAALSCVTAAVVGVIANLSVYLALHTLFADVGERAFGPLVLYVPTLTSLRLDALFIALVCGLGLLRGGLGMAKTLGLAAALGLATMTLRA